MTDDGAPLEHGSRVEDPNLLLLGTIFALVVLASGVIDLILDEPETLWSGHVLFELGMIVLSLGAASYLGSGWYRSLTLTRELRSSVRHHQEERDAWKSRAGHLLAGLGEAMSAQLEAWSLTPTEKETALMLLKGFSHKRIARLTSRSERTVRQHSVAVYRKSGLAGRAELAGFFLDDLLLPEDRLEDAHG
jgi:DNA-binding CsgD family transcriptional regulator